MYITQTPLNLQYSLYQYNACFDCECWSMMPMLASRDFLPLSRVSESRMKTKADFFANGGPNGYGYGYVGP